MACRRQSPDDLEAKGEFFNTLNKDVTLITLPHPQNCSIVGMG
jgi:hypothetical protein